MLQISVAKHSLNLFIWLLSYKHVFVQNSFFLAKNRNGIRLRITTSKPKVSNNYDAAVLVSMIDKPGKRTAPENQAAVMGKISNRTFAQSTLIIANQ